MKTKFIVLLILLLILPIGCSANNKVSEKEKVIINMPEDNSVNGYRLSVESNSSDDDSISAENVYVESGHTTKPNVQNSKGLYCANKNSKIFHFSDCSSAKKTKEENKFYSKDREQLIKDGYTPCKQCKP